MRELVVGTVRGWQRALCGALALLLAGVASADVTVTQESTVNVLVVTARTRATEKVAGQKERRDSDTRLDGPLALLAGTTRSADIVRLDRDLTWRLDVDKKRYTEVPFPTPEQRAADEQKMQAMLEKAKQCPMPAPSQSPPRNPTEGCEKSEPKFDARNTDDAATIAGHPTRRTVLSMTYTCKNVQTGDVCDMTVTEDLWLSQDTVPGYDERKAFALDYARKLGLDELTGPISGPVRTAMAPYLEQIQKVVKKAGDIKGAPLRTSLSVSIGGAQCAAAKAAPGGPSVADASTAARDAAAQSAQGSADSAAHSALDNAVGGSAVGRALGAATGAFGSKLASGLFGKKSEPKPADAAPASAAAAPVARSLLSLTTEVTSISTDAIAPDQFEIPGGFQKSVPKPAKDEEFTCPKAGG